MRGWTQELTKDTDWVMCSKVKSEVFDLTNQFLIFLSSIKSDLVNLTKLYHFEIKLSWLTCGLPQVKIVL